VRRGLACGSISMSCAKAYQSRSTRYNATRNCARVTGSIGINGGCGKRSSRYSMMTSSRTTPDPDRPASDAVVGIQIEQVLRQFVEIDIHSSIAIPFSASTRRVR